MSNSPGNIPTPDDGNNSIAYASQVVEKAKRGIKPDPEVIDAMMLAYQSVISHPAKDVSNWLQSRTSMENLRQWRDVEVDDFDRLVRDDQGYAVFEERDGRKYVKYEKKTVQQSVGLYPEVHKVPDTQLGVLLYMDMQRFVPPERIQKKDYVQENTIAYWRELTEMILREAQRRTIDQPLVQARLRQYESEAIIGIKRPHAWDKSDSDTLHPLHFDVDTTAPGSSKEIQHEVANVLDMARAELRRGIADVLSDVDFIDARRKAFEVKHMVEATTILGENIKHFNYLRSEVEDPAEVERFLDILRQVVEMLGYDDLDVQLLSTEDAITRHCMGLYTPAKNGQRAKISIPMSVYGTSEMMPIKVTLDTVAHEVAHHDMAVMGQNVIMTDQPVHGFTHDALTARREEQVSRLSIIPEQKTDGTMGLKVIRDPAKDPLLRHASLVQAMRDEMAKFAPMVKAQLEGMPTQSAKPALTSEASVSTGMSPADRTKLASSVAAEVAQQLGPTVNTAVKNALAGKQQIQAPAALAKKPWWKVFGK